MLRRADQKLWQYRAANNSTVSDGNERFLRLYLIAMAILAWFTVLTGTYVNLPMVIAQFHRPGR